MINQGFVTDSDTEKELKKWQQARTTAVDEDKLKQQRRIALEEKRYALMKQKISGEYDVDPDTGEIDDSYTEDSEDGEV